MQTYALVKVEANIMIAMQNKNTTESGPESPTTARPLDLSDDEVQDTGILGDDGPRSPVPPAVNAPASTTETAPQKPPRPQTEAQKNLQILKEAFPSVDQGIIKAVLSASGGKVEPAFNALLGKPQSIFTQQSHIDVS